MQKKGKLCSHTQKPNTYKNDSDDAQDNLRTHAVVVCAWARVIGSVYTNERPRRELVSRVVPSGALFDSQGPRW
jgi:hypothetical protein